MIRLLNMSFAAGCTAMVVMFLRLFLRRLPKGYSYALWMCVLFRFLCPVVIPSPFSLLPMNAEPVKQEIVYQEEPEIETGVIWIDRAVNGVVGERLAVQDAANSINPVQVWLAIGFMVWVAGVSVFVGYYLLRMLYLRRKLTAAIEKKGVRVGKKQKVLVRESDQIDGAFVMGIVHPAIYLPAGMDEENREYVLRHEIEHIRRKDYLVKMLGLLSVAVHWFNPLSWISFRLLCADMEMSCDERVLRESHQDERGAYSRALLAEAEKRSGLLPLAFVKNFTYRRIRNILAYHRRGAVLMTVVAVILGGIGIGLVTSPGQKEGAGNPSKADAGQEEKATEETPASVSIIGGADGPTSIFVAGKLGDEEGGGWQKERPDSQWLASVSLKNPAVLDFASEDSLIFHGDFGFFSFEKGEDGRWEQQIFVADAQAGEEMARIICQDKVMGAEGIHLEDAMKGHSSHEESSRNIECGVNKMADGRIAVLGTWAPEEGEGRLIDLYYGYYDPQEQEMRQVFLFMGDGKEIENPQGEISESRWLFERDGFDYYIRTPRSPLPFEQSGNVAQRLYHSPYGRMELAKSGEGKEELLDNLVYIEKRNRQKMVLTEERLIYQGFAEATVIAVKRTLPVSIRMDGSDRRVGDVRYGTADGLCYADGYLYYEGWSNEGAFPKPLMRMKPDFTEEEKVGELPGSLITVRDGGACLWIDWETKQIMAGSVEKMGDSKEYWEYLKNGETGRRETCRMKNMGDGYLQVVLTNADNPSEEEIFWLWLPSNMWDEEF